VVRGEGALAPVSRKEEHMGITGYGAIHEAKYSEGGTYILPGVYRFEVLACKHITTRKKQDAFVVELKVLESTHPQRLPGSSCSWMVTLDKEPALGNIKQFIMAATGCEEGAVTEQVVLAIVGTENPLKGTLMRCSAVEISTKAGRPFTKVKWFEDGIGAAGAASAHRENA
jgi:hypothetical protein